MFKLYVNNELYASYVNIKDAIKDADYFYNNGNDTEILDG